MSQKEVSRRLGLSIGIVRSVEQRALCKLRRQAKALRELQGLLALKHDGLWARPYWVLSGGPFCQEGINGSKRVPRNA